MLTQIISIYNWPAVDSVCTIERPEFSCLEGLGGWPVYSRAMVCPSCLRAWATLQVIGQSRYCIEETTCLQCAADHVSTPTRFPGSLLASYTCNGVDWGLIDVLPEPLLRREFQIALETLSHVHDG